MEFRKNHSPWWSQLPGVCSAAEFSSQLGGVASMKLKMTRVVDGSLLLSWFLTALGGPEIIKGPPSDEVFPPDRLPDRPPPSSASRNMPLVSSLPVLDPRSSKCHGRSLPVGRDKLAPLKDIWSTQHA